MSMFEIHGGFTGLAASSRVRLARNIKGYPFRLTEQQHSEIADKIFAALKENPTIGPEFDKKQIIPVRQKASQLVEEHLISPSLAQNGGWLDCLQGQRPCPSWSARKIICVCRSSALAFARRNVSKPQIV